MLLPLRVRSSKTIILDIDGTLVDSNDAHAASWVDALRAYGIEVPFERVRPLIGKGGDKVLPEVSGVDPESARGREISARRKAIFREEYLPKLAPFSGARALLERMKRDGFTLVVGTSAEADLVSGLLDVAKVRDLVDETTTSDDAERSKPDPDIVEAAVAEAGAEPRRAWMLGDTPYDIEAAARAGVRCVALRCGGWDDAALAGAIAIYDDPLDLLSRYETSPFAAER